ncbi:MAG: ATP-binding cassette domain-containing protein, partial [Lachnospiraceae bacterium]|nr:ATP-binding cassette domain-containing protein [Lachnospiraceae bacterium]
MGIENDILVQMKDVTVSFGKNKKKKTVLSGVELMIRRGEIVGLAGESGSGKSTIAKAILGMVPVENGTITLNTKAPQMVFQDPYSSLNPAMTIGWIMQEPLKLAPKRDPEAKCPDAAARKAKVAEMLHEVGLD